MDSVRATKLPGVGVRHDFRTSRGDELSVLVHHDGRREILVYDSDDPDICRSIVALNAADTRTLSELLGASRVTEAVAAVQQEIEGLTIEWVHIEGDSPAIGRTIGGGKYRTRTGASIVAVIRDDRSIPAPGPEFELDAADTVVAVGTADGLASLRGMLRA